MGKSTKENVTDDATTALHECVSYVKVTQEVKLGYMNLEEYIYWRAKAETEANLIQCILTLLEEYGEVPEELRERISEQDSSVLKSWLKIAAKAGSIEKFIRLTGMETD